MIEAIDNLNIRTIKYKFYKSHSLKRRLYFISIFFNYYNLLKFVSFGYISNHSDKLILIQDSCCVKNGNNFFFLHLKRKRDV